jgi:transketolase
MAFENKRRNDEAGYKELAAIAAELRRDIIRSLLAAGSGHSGGPLGLSDMFSVLYFGGVMRYKADTPDWNGRDRFVLSAGHLCPVLYAALANAGFFPKEELLTLRKFGSRLQGHPGLDMHLPGIETSTGSLGHGISIAVGMAIADLLVDKSDRVVITLTGDGELQEGSVWEAAMSAAHWKLDNFCWIIDNNDCQIDGRVKDIMSVYPIVDKCKAFGFETIEIDGHSFEEMYKAMDFFADNHRRTTGKPTAIVAKTFMGKGVSFMHDKFEWHGKPPNKEQAEQALNELTGV